MADDRPAEGEIEAIVTLRTELADLRSTLLARVSRRPTGDIEPTLRTVAKADSLILNGQVVARSSFAPLWQWVQDNGLVVAGLFTSGDGVNTFGLPDFRGRVLRGVPAAGEAIGALTGGDTLTLLTANLPSHTHNVAVAAHGNHGHNLTGGSVPGGGGHGGHNSGSFGVAAGGDGATAGNGNTFVGDHGHGAVAVFADANSAGSHTVTQSPAGSDTPFDRRQASVNVNWLIWT